MIKAMIFCSAATRKLALLTTSAMIAAMAPVAVHAQAQTVEFDIPAQSLDSALRTFARASQQQILFDGDLVRGKQSVAVSGSYPVREALARLLEGSGLSASQGTRGAWVIRTTGAPGESIAAGGGDSAGSYGGDAVESGKGISEILVVGAKTQNVDIRRTEDDPQPYVVFEGEEIRQSGANNLEDFMRRRLPQNNISGYTNNQQVSSPIAANNISKIQLRGLSAEQTLILIDGRRAPRVASSGSNTQADINGIPLAAIERIEILPATAGGIYGGNAVGGVINIVRKRDYRGIVIGTSLDGTFRGGGETLRFDLSGGLNLEGGRTQIGFSASRSAARPLYRGDNDLWRRGREEVLSLIEARPGLSLFPSATPNIQAAPIFVNGIQTRPNLVLDNGTPLGSSRTFVPVGYKGYASDNGAGLLANAGSTNIDLSPDYNGNKSQIITTPRIESANINIRRNFTNWLDIFTDISGSRNSSLVFGRPISNYQLLGSSPNNPFQQNVTVFIPLPEVAVPFRAVSTSVSGTVGAVLRLGSGWSTTTEYSYARSRIRTSGTGNPISSAGLTALRTSLPLVTDLISFPIDLSPYLAQGPDNFQSYSTVQHIGSLRLAGSPMRIWGGKLAITGLLEYRKERLPEGSNRGAFSQTFFPSRSQSVTSGYLEVTAPIISEQNSVPLIHDLEIQTSIRHDQYASIVPSPSTYTIFSPTSSVPTISHLKSSNKSSDVTVALRWSPGHGLTFRTSYGTGFLPPRLSLLTPAFRDGAITDGYLDPKRGGQLLGSVLPYRQQSGGDLELRPERSRNFSVGAILTPTLFPGVRLSVDYVRIAKRDEITSLLPQYILEHESLFPNRIVRGPVQPGDPVGWAGPVIEINTSSLNALRTRLQSLDFNFEYSRKSAWGDLKLYVIATRAIQFERQALPTTASIDTVDFADGPLRWSGNAGLNWQRNSWSVGWNVQYINSRNLCSATALEFCDQQVGDRGGKSRVRRQIYNDIYINYNLGNSSNNFLENTRIFLGIQNIFDTKPPYLIGDATPYDFRGDPRLRRYTIGISRGF